ncbi:SH3 domain-containing protein, partial [Cribrihabitans sp. XS_ASV171]
MIRRLFWAGAALAGFLYTGPVLAEIPQFVADCPAGGRVTSDGVGTVRVSGNVATTQAFSQLFYEARYGGVTISISHDGGGNNLGVSYDVTGGQNGVCTILSWGGVAAGGGTAVQLPEAPPAGAQPDDRLFVSLLSSNGRLNLRDAPSASGRVLASLRNGMTVASVGPCTGSGTSRWCEIQAGNIRGWAAARFLRRPGPGAGAPPDDGGGAMAGADGVRVRFAPGTSGARIPGELLPGQS